MNNKGFTLMEILGVITLLAILSTLIILSVNKSLKDSKETLYQQQIEEIKAAAGMWRTDNIEIIPDNDYCIVSLQQLKDEGYIKKDIINPKTDAPFDNITLGVSLNDIKVDSLENILANKGYTKLDYIESTGNNYIDTKIIANENTGFEIEFSTSNEFGEWGTTGYGSIFGARTSSKVNELQLTTYKADESYSGTLRFETKNYNAGIESKNKKVKISLKNKKYIDSKGVQTDVVGSFTTPVPLTIFALNENGNIIQNGTVKLYSFKIYEGDILIRDFMPVEDLSGIQLLYEKKENKEYRFQTN